MAAAYVSEDVDSEREEQPADAAEEAVEAAAAAAVGGGGHRRVKRRRLLEDEDDEDDGNERAAAAAAVSPFSPPRRYHLRPSSVSSAPSGRLQAVDAVLQRLRQQRAGGGERDWMVATSSTAGSDEEAEQEPRSAGSADAASPSRPPPPAGRQSRRSTRSSQAARRREEAEDSEADQAEAADDGDWFVAEDDEADGDDAAIARMRLRHEQEMEEEEGEGEGQEQAQAGMEAAADTAAASSVASSVSAAPLLSSSLFASGRLRLPLGAGSGFWYWSLYLTAALVDAQVSTWLQSAPSTRSLVSSAVKAVEETFSYQRTAWVRSSSWEQRSRAAFLHALDSLPYAASSRLTQREAVDADTGLPMPPLSASCAACGQHRPSHRLRLYGVAYQPEQLQHPFDTARIFPDGWQYRDVEMDVGELCHARCRLYHSMRHYKLHVMLGLRALLSRVQAEPAALEHNRDRIRQMFDAGDHEEDEDGGARPPLSASSPAGLTAAFVRQQRSVHAELMRQSEQYTRGDARTVRIDVSALDALQPDLADAACASFLFNLRPPAPVPSAEQAEVEQRSAEQTQEEAQEAAVQPAVSEPRRLLLRAVAQTATEAELRLLHALLPQRLRRKWASCASETDT